MYVELMHDQVKLHVSLEIEDDFRCRLRLTWNVLRHGLDQSLVFILPLESLI